MKGGYSEAEPCCKNCAYKRSLMVYTRVLSYNKDSNAINIGIQKSRSSHDESLCCVFDNKRDLDAPIYEVNPDDKCENYIQLIENIDNSSMYGNHMITVEFPNPKH